MDHNACLPVHGPEDLSRPYNSLNAGKLKRVLETPETSYPSRYSIPAFSPRTSMIEESIRDNESNVGSTDHEQESGYEKSTVESLLDKHIECLGLQPENIQKPLEDPKSLKDDATEASASSTSKDENTVRITLDSAHECWFRAQTTSSPNATATANSEQRSLIPTKVFSPDASKILRATAAQSGPCVSKVLLHDSSGMPSVGWTTLASTSNLSLDDLPLSQCAIRSSQPDRENLPTEAEVKQLSTSQMSPSTSSCWSGDSADLYNWNDDVPTKQRPRQRGLNRQISQHRRMRMRLKLKRNSQSRSRICASERSSARESFNIVRAPSQDRVNIPEPLAEQKVDVLESHDTFNVKNCSEHIAGTALPQQASSMHPLGTSPDIPTRRSSIVASAAQRVKRGVDVARKMSVKTVRSHCSNASIVEPLNSTRLSAVAPHLDAPDLGPLLTPGSMSLNMNFAFPPAAITAPAGLRATQSFFSDDSSAIQNHRGSLRRRFNLPSLRSVLPSSPRAHSMVSVPGRNNQYAQSRLHQSCHLQGLKQEDDGCDLYGTAGMSDFAYCRRKILERVKDWWKRQCMQRKLGLKRGKGDRKLSQDH